MMNIPDFITAYIGQNVPNNFGGFEGECLSLLERFAHEVQGVPNAESIMYVNDARILNLWVQYGGKLAEYYDQVPFSGVSNVRAGDFLIWGTSKGHYGHGAIAIENGSMRVFEQLGTPVFVPAKISTATSSGLLGILRRKGSGMENELIEARAVASVRRDNLSRLEQAAGVDTGIIEPDLGVDEAIRLIDGKNTQIKELTKSLSLYQAAGGDANKWEIFKTLVRELVGR